MKGMVRMGSSNALQALGMAGPASVMLTLSSAATGDNKGLARPQALKPIP